MFCCCAAEDPGVSQVIDSSAIFDEPQGQQEPLLVAAAAAPTAKEAPAEDEEAKQVFPPEKVAQDFVVPGPDATVFAAQVYKREGGTWGFKADFCDHKTIHICHMTLSGETALMLYNNSVPEDKRMNIGDYILSINGISEATVDPPSSVADAMREQLQVSQSIDLKVSHPFLFSCSFARHGQPMGLELTYSDNALSLCITRVAEGAVLSFAPEIREGDRIIGVDGITGTPEDLKEAVRNAGDRVVLKMSRHFETRTLKL